MNRISMAASPAVRFQSARKFSQKELEQALVQMNQEREAEARDVKKVADKLGGLLHQTVSFEDVFANHHFGMGFANPAQPVDYRLTLSYSQYDRGPAEYLAEMNKIPGMKVLSATTTPSRRIEDHYEWDVSSFPEFANNRQKVFRIRFDQYDAHAGGW